MILFPIFNSCRVIAFNNFRLIFDLLKADAFYQIIFELQNFGNSEIAFVYAKGLKRSFSVSTIFSSFRMKSIRFDIFRNLKIEKLFVNVLSYWIFSWSVFTFSSLDHRSASKIVEKRYEFCKTDRNNKVAMNRRKKQRSTILKCLKSPKSVRQIH